MERVIDALLYTAFSYRSLRLTKPSLLKSGVWPQNREAMSSPYVTSPLLGGDEGRSLFFQKKVVCIATITGSQNDGPHLVRQFVEFFHVTRLTGDSVLIVLKTDRRVFIDNCSVAGDEEDHLICFAHLFL